MGYMVEVAFDTRRRSDVSALQSKLRSLSSSCGGDEGYFVHELEGKGRNTTEQNCVFTCCFEMEDDYDETNKSPNDSDLANCKHFLSLLSREAGVFVETVTNTSGYNIIYASAKFLRRMGKSYNKAYKAKRLTLSITDEEKEMLSAIKRK